MRRAKTILTKGIPFFKKYYFKMLMFNIL